MVFGIYDPPDGSPLQAWSDLKIGDICDAVEFDYTKYFCGAGTFTLVIPRNSAYADKIYAGCFLISKAENISAEEYNGFIVKNIVYENDTLKLTGYDLNGLLLDRITLYPQEYADMAVKVGSTEEIVKYYVDYNCVSSTDVERNFPALGIAENKNRGIANDAASPRLECVADVIANILGAQDMGYRVYPLLDRYGDAILEFDVFEAVARTQNQNVNSRVTFSFGLGNVARMKREIGVTADKNTFYCELSSGTVQRYYKKPSEEEVPPEGEAPSEETAANEKHGYDRREEYLKLSCELAEIEVYAEHEIADRYRLTDSLEITAGNPLDYGSVYNVGDIVTVYDRERKLQLDSIISASEIKRTGTEYTVKITLGDSKPKVLDSYAKKGQATANSVRTAFGGGSLVPVSSYEYVSDNSVKMNGITFEVEKNAAGLITKITDSGGNVLKPEGGGNVTDIALHNAVFWATAMTRGINAGAVMPDTMPEMGGITGYFIPEKLRIADGVWVDYFEISDMNIYGDPVIETGALRLQSNQHGAFISTTELMTVYVVFKNLHISYTYTTVVAKHMTTSMDQYYGFDITLAPNTGIIMMSCRGSTVTSQITARDTWHVVCITRNTSTAKLYIDGVYIGSSRCELGLYSGEFLVNRCMRGPTDADQPGDHLYKMLAFGVEEHTDSQVALNSEWLANKYIAGGG